MRTIVVDDERIMLRQFGRLSRDIADLNLVGSFECASDAVRYAMEYPVELAFIDIVMPVLNGVELARELRKIRPEMVIVFVTAYDSFIRDFNQIGGDYYILKPFTRETLEMTMSKIRYLSRRLRKEVYIQTFGRFVVLKNGKPLPLRGKTKEILALIVIKRGREISNEEIYNTVWEERAGGGDRMNVYYNDLHRLRRVLKNAGYGNMLIATQRGQMVDVDCFTCDYYEWLDGNADMSEKFTGEFLSEYSWSEAYLADILRHEDDLEHAL